MGQYVAVLNYYDPVQAVETYIAFARGPGIAPTDAPYIPSGLMKWVSPTQKISIAAPATSSVTPSDDAGTNITSSQTDQGEVDILNVPLDISQPGPFDYLNNMIFQGRLAQLYWLPGKVWANKVLCWTSVLEQPIIQLNLGSSVQAYYQFILRDPRATLTANIQAALYGGTNVGATGVDGETSLLNKPKPILYGRVSNIPGVLVNTEALIYQLADKPATVDCVRDGGASITVGTQRANVASLQNNTPTPGTYDWSAATGEGTFVKLGTKPQFTLTFDAYEGSTIASRTGAQLWVRMREDRCFTASAAIDLTSAAAVDALDSAESGWWFSDQTDQQSALDTILGGFSGFEIMNQAGLWTVQKLELPAASEVAKFRATIPIIGKPQPANARPIATLTFVRPDYMPDGVPPFEVLVDWGQNYTIMATTDFAGIIQQAAPRLVSKFALQWRQSIAQNLAAWNPTTNVGPWKNAPNFEMASGYAVGPDGLTCPGADAEAGRLLSLFGVVRPQAQLTFAGRPGDYLQPGDAMILDIAQYGFSGGVMFRVLQAGLTLDQNGYVPAAIIGLARLLTDQNTFTLDHSDLDGPDLLG